MDTEQAEANDVLHLFLSAEDKKSYPKSGADNLPLLKEELLQFMDALVTTRNRRKVYQTTNFTCAELPALDPVIALQSFGQGASTLFITQRCFDRLYNLIKPGKTKTSKRLSLIHI